MTSVDVVAYQLVQRFLVSSWSAKRRLTLSRSGDALEWRDVAELQRDDRDDVPPLGALPLADIRRVKRDQARCAADRHGVRVYFTIVAKDESVLTFACDTEREMVAFVIGLSAACGLPCDEKVAVASATDPLGVVHSGWLDKRGAVNTGFKRRFVVLRRNHQLQWALGAKSVPKGSVELGVHDVEQQSAAAAEFSLWTAARKFFFRAESPADAAAWTAALRACRRAPVDDEPASAFAPVPSAAERPLAVVGAAEPLFALERWSAFDVLDEFVAADADSLPPVPPPASASVLCANQSLATLSDEHARRLGAALALEAARNHFVELPRALAQATALTHLDLGNNRIAALDAQLLGSLSSLVVLTLSNNGLHALPDTIGQLAQLRELHLQNDGDVGAGGNRLRELPASLGRCTALELLDVSLNGALADLPWTLVACRRMRTLRLSSNSLAHVPACVSTMQLLSELAVKHNQLTRLDPVVFGLTALERLHVQFNQIREIAAPVSFCTRLDELFFEGNPIVLKSAHVGTSLSKVMAMLRTELLAPAPCFRLGACLAAHSSVVERVLATLQPFRRAASRDNVDLDLPLPAHADLLGAASLVNDDARTVQVRVHAVPLKGCDAFHSGGGLALFGVRVDGAGVVDEGDAARVTSDIERLVDTRRQSWRLPLTAVTSDGVAPVATQLALRLPRDPTVRDALDAVVATMPTKTAPERAKALRCDAAARMVLGGLGADDDLLDGVLVLGVCDDEAVSADAVRDALRGAFPRLAALEASAPKTAAARFVALRAGDDAASEAVASTLSTLAVALAMRSPTKTVLPFALQRAHVELALCVEQFRDYSADARFVPLLTHAEFGRLAEACGIAGAPHVRACWRLLEAWGVTCGLVHSLHRRTLPLPAAAATDDALSPTVARLASAVVRAFGRRAFLLPAEEAGSRALTLWPTPRSLVCAQPARLVALAETDFAALRVRAQRDELFSLPQAQRLLTLAVDDTILEGADDE